ncbi:MAG: hypothetical protein WC942_06445 [Clostridia bacterium]|jgi:hypothetical protein
MRILFSGNNYIGSNVMLQRLIKAADKHDVKVMSYYRNHTYLHHIDWCLDPVIFKRTLGKKYFKEYYNIDGPSVNNQLAEIIVNDLVGWEPELVISDCEKLSATLAGILQIPLWYCSPMLQMIGIQHDKKTLDSLIFAGLKNRLELLPEGNKYLIYSPLCDIEGRPFLKDGFEWCRPYYEEPGRSTTEQIDISLVTKIVGNCGYFTTGETSFVSDCIYTNKPIFIGPHPKELEQLLNAQLCEWYGVAKNIGRFFNISFLEKAVEPPYPEYKLSIQEWKQLHERFNNE